MSEQAVLCDRTVEGSGLCSQAKSGVVIGLDFGSTLSAAAVAWPADSEAPLSIDNLKWKIVEKFETRLSFSPEKPSELVFTTTKDVPVGQRKLALFKLWLMDEGRQGANAIIMRRAKHNTHDIELPATEKITSIFLKGLWEKAKQAIVDKGTSPLHVVVGYPSEWSDVEVDRLKAAVEEAGILKEVCDECKVFYCTEQEAAAHGVDLQHRADEDFRMMRKTGGAFLVVDMGGMTTDAAVFNVRPQTDAHSSLQGDIQHSTSCFDAGILLDYEVEAVTDKLILRAAQQSENSYLRACYEGRKRIGSFWQMEIKQDFTQRQHANHCWHFDVQGHKIALYGHHLMAAIDRVLNPIVDLIWNVYDQAKTKPKVLIVTGGMLLCPEVRACIETQIEKRIKDGIEAGVKNGHPNHLPPRIIMSDNYQALYSVCQGAVLHLLSK